MLAFAAANFDQGQISLTVQGPGTSAVVGFDPNALNGQFTIPGGSGFSFTPWFLLSGSLTYSGPGAAPFLLNINVQYFTASKGRSSMRITPSSQQCPRHHPSHSSPPALV